MRPRPLPFVVALAIAAISGAARADDDGHRFGLVGLIGGGVGGVVHPGPLAGPIAFSDLGVEILGEVRPWGGFVRAEYLSSGDSARWTVFAFSGGAEYRLFGDAHRTALFLRGGLAYERWNGNSAGCPIDLFVPNSCNLIGTMASSFDVSTDMLGVIAGARVEAPLGPVYGALSGNFVPVVAIDSSNPSAAFELRFTFELGFRDRRTDDGAVRVETRSRGGGLKRRDSAPEEQAPPPPP
jgi:hypothetical protein